MLFCFFLRKQQQDETKTTKWKRAKSEYVELINCNEVFEILQIGDFKDFENILFSHKDKGFAKFTLNGDDYSKVVINKNILIDIYNQENKEINKMIMLNKTYQNEIMLDEWMTKYATEELDPNDHDKLYDELKKKKVLSYYSFDNEDHIYDFKSDLDFNKLKSPLKLAGINNKGK